MNKVPEIIRTKLRAEGGITPEEKARMAEHSKLWISRAMRTKPIEPSKIIPVIKEIYAVSGLKEPRVVIVPSPLVMAFAYGASAAIWHKRKTNATDNATRNATDKATDKATDNAEKLAANACLDLAGRFGILCARRWGAIYQGGNMWSASESYLTACRDILGLELPDHKKYQPWGQAAIHGGFRVMHEEFCMVCDFPEILNVNDNNQPHCEDGPSHKWRDGWALYHWHGTKVPAHWIEDKSNLDPNEILKTENVEQRAAGCQIIGWHKMLDHLDHKIIDSDPDPEHGDLIEVTLDGLPEPEWYLKFECPRNGVMMEGVNRRELSEPTVFAAQAWKSPLPNHLFTYPKTRT